MKSLNLSVLVSLVVLSFVFSVDVSAQVSPFEYCYKMLRVKMLRKKMEFIDASGSKVDDGFNNYNGEFSKLNKPIYSYLQLAEAATVESAAKTLILKYEGNDNSYLEYSMSSNSTEDTEFLFGIKIEYKKAIRAPFIKIAIQQEFKVQRNCRLEIVSSKRLSLTKVATGSYQVEQAYTAYDGADQNVSRLLRTADGSNLLNEEIIEDKYMVRAQNSSGYFYVGEETPLAKLKIERSKPEMKSGLDSRKVVELSTANMQLSFGDEQALTFNVALNDASDRGVYFIPRAGFGYYTVDYWIWITKSLDASVSKFNPVVSHLTEADFEAETPLKIQIKSLNPLQYKRIGSYWNIDHQEVTQEPLKYTYLLSESTKPYMHAESATIKELEDTAALEFNSPEVQTLVGEILSLGPKTREEKVTLILEMINSLIKYDDRMVQVDTVRFLKSTEIIKKKTGVCQHFAVLFVALARAIKVPAIVVSGYSLSGKTAIRHAWVEYEKAPGQWVVVEPQSMSAELYRTHAYLPLGRDLAVEQGANQTEVSENGGGFLEQMEIQKRE